MSLPPSKERGRMSIGILNINSHGFYLSLIFNTVCMYISVAEMKADEERSDRREVIVKYYNSTSA